MSEFKGTKGEWKIYDSDDESVTITIQDESQAIAFLPELFEDTIYNAKLIACAPKMLEALKEMISFAEFHGYTSSTEINNARIIIKKATE